MPPKKPQTPAKRREYTPTEISEALRVLAYHGGNAARASEATGVPEGTLYTWRLYKHRDQYSDICQREGPKLEAIAAEQARELILRASDAEQRILDRLENDRLDPKDLKSVAGALQHITTSKGINGTKLLELTGRPTQITEHRDGDSILRELRQRVPQLFVDSTAQDITAVPLEGQSKRANARELPDRVSRTRV